MNALLHPAPPAAAAAAAVACAPRPSSGVVVSAAPPVAKDDIDWNRVDFDQLFQQKKRAAEQAVEQVRKHPPRRPIAEIPHI
jgi:hypothetical protein